MNAVYCLTDTLTFLSASILLMLAKTEPEMLCQTLKMAQGGQGIGGEVCRSQGDGQTALLDAIEQKRI